MIINAAKAAEAAETLGVELEALNPDVLNTAYRAKARDHHPDKVADFNPEVWARISWAKEVLVRWLANKPAPVEEVAEDACRACAGTGRVAVGPPRGFGAKRVTLQCVMCNGEGVLNADQQRLYNRGD